MIYSFTPFEHCQNAKFIFRIWSNDPTINNTWDIPIWITINETAATFEVNTLNVSSIGTNPIYLQAQLIAHSLDENNNDFYSSWSLSVFKFENENANLLQFPSNIYLVLNVSKSINVLFFDQEGDRVNFILTNTENVGAFIKRINNTYFNVIMQCDDLSVSKSTLSFKYTDRYHTDAEYWKQVTMNVDIYPSEPPYFTQSLNNITINNWNNDNYLYILPKAIDPDGGNVQISLASETPSWIQIQSNSLVSVIFKFHFIYQTLKLSWFQVYN